MIKKRKIIKSIGFVFIILSVLFIFLFTPSYTNSSNLERGCLYNLKQIAVALQRYVESEGSGIYLPDNLDILFKDGYLNDRRILFCPEHRSCQYKYIGGLTCDMPLIIPVLFEESLNHNINSDGKGDQKTGFCVTLDFEVWRGCPWSGEVIQRSLGLIYENNIDVLLKVLKKTDYSSLEREIGIWRLGKLGNDSKVYLRNILQSHIWISHHFQTACSLAEMGDESGIEALWKYLAPPFPNKYMDIPYPNRKRAWIILKKVLGEDKDYHPLESLKNRIIFTKRWHDWWKNRISGDRGK